jgi:PAS domain S-box-containing protein
VLAPLVSAAPRWPAPAYVLMAAAGALAILAFGGAFAGLGAWTRWAGGAGVLGLAGVLAWHMRMLLREARAQERRYRHLFSRSPSALVIHRAWQIVACNDAAARIMGLARPEDLIGRDLLSFYDEASRERARARLQALAALAPGESLPLADLVIVRPDGRQVIVEATSTRVDLPDGPATESMFLDVTEHRQAQAALRRSEALLTGLFEACPDIITVTEPETGRYVRVNRRFTEVIGYAPEEAVGRTVLELGMLPSQAERERFLGVIEREGRIVNFPMRYRTKDGREMPMRIAGTFFDAGGRRYLLVMSRDMSEHQRVLAEYRAIFDNASVGIVLVRRGRMRQVNERFERMLGWPVGSLAGRSVRDIWPSDEAFARVRATAQRAIASGQPLDFEWQMWRRDGSPFWARSRATVLRDVPSMTPAQDGRDTIWIVEDVTTEREAVAQLAAAKEQAEAASRAKSAFLANMSHEIRTPLHGVLGLAQLAALPEVEPDRREDYLQRLVESARSLSAVISDILDLSKIEAGRLRLESIEFDLPELLQALHDTYGELARAKSLDFQVERPADLPTLVCADPVRLRQILGNFLSNALKFTERGRITLRVDRGRRGGWRFEVEDTGPGIDPALHDRIFEPFIQADDSTTRRYGGTGLGLSICRQLARLMGGEVGVRSQPGQGSVFWAELPLHEVQPHTLPQALGGPDAQALQGARVLVVEDNPVNMMIAVSMLERWGIEVVQACDGQQALEAVERDQGRFDAVLMDVHMPDMSGYDVTARIRRRHGPEALPIIALTAAAMVTEQRRAREAGMNDFVPKPIDLDDLHATLHRWVRPRAS